MALKPSRSFASSESPLPPTASSAATMLVNARATTPSNRRVASAVASMGQVNIAAASWSALRHQASGAARAGLCMLLDGRGAGRDPPGPRENSLYVLVRPVKVGNVDRVVGDPLAAHPDPGYGSLNLAGSGYDHAQEQI